MSFKMQAVDKVSTYSQVKKTKELAKLMHLC